jgi:hypothetical protein
VSFSVIVYACAVYCVCVCVCVCVCILTDASVGLESTAAGNDGERHRHHRSVRAVSCVCVCSSVCCMLCSVCDVHARAHVTVAA